MLFLAYCPVKGCDAGRDQATGRPRRGGKRDIKPFIVFCR
jgi:hypothetical protein